MVYEHEIPTQSKLYFGKSAEIKRKVEATASTLLKQRWFEEIVTPVFSYHQHDYIDDRHTLVRIGNDSNYEVTLRADSTADLIRIVTKRLGRSTSSKKWFYIQPVYTFPTKESYQIGAEVIEGGFEEALSSALALIQSFQLTPYLQISNIRIPKLLSEKYGIALEEIKHLRIEKMLQSNHAWMAHLLAINSKDDLEDLSLYPDDIREELSKIAVAVESIDYKRVLIAPLYYANLRYYDALLFRLFENNQVIATGGRYTIEQVDASGFALYTDSCIAMLSQEDDG